jgi:hypothetical protein
VYTNPDLHDLPSFPGCFVSELHYNDADEDVCVEVGKIFYRYRCSGYVGLSIVAAYPLKNLLILSVRLLQIVRVPHAHELNQELVTLWTQSFSEDISDLIFACNMTDFHLSFFNKVTYLVISDVDML